MNPDLDPDRFAVHHASVRGVDLAFVREHPGGVPLVCVHGWPETKRIYWRVSEPGRIGPISSSALLIPSILRSICCIRFWLM